VASNPMFVSNEMKNINMAAKSLCEWVHAVDNFSDIYKEITNKKEISRVMDIELQKAN
jgi:dynein heavy chain